MPHTIEKVRPHVAKVPRFIGPMATWPNPGRKRTEKTRHFRKMKRRFLDSVEYFAGKLHDSSMTLTKRRRAAWLFLTANPARKGIRTYIYIDFSMVAPIPWRYRSQNDLQRIFKIICFLADPGNAICKSEAVND